jgi:uncharacterized lipoprotein YmbA
VTVDARLLAPLCAVVFTVGCTSVLPKPVKSDFFVLTALEPAASPAPTPDAPSVLLGRVALPPYLDRPELVTRLANNQLRVDDVELWGEPLRDGCPRTIEQDLAALLGGARVHHLPWTLAVPPDLVVAVEVRRFEPTAAGKVELAASWSIHDGRGENERLRRETRLSYPVGGSGPRAAVGSMSEALAALSREIAEGVRCLALAGADGGGDCGARVSAAASAARASAP